MRNFAQQRAFFLGFMAGMLFLAAARAWVG